MVSPVKRNAYKIIEPDLDKSVDPNLIASVTIAGVTIEMAEHTEGNHVKSTGALIRVKPITIKLMEDALIRNTWFQDKLSYDQATGGFRPDSEGRFDLIIQQLSVDRITPIKEFEYGDCIISEDDWEESENTSTDNQMQTITVLPTTREIRSL